MARRLIVMAGIMAGMVLALTACDTAKDLRDELGLKRQSPDEFRVVRRAPLEIPATLSDDVTLPKPTPGVDRPQETAPRNQAIQALIGQEAPAAQTGLSSGEAALLQQAGATQTPSDIRRVVDEENKEWLERNIPVVEKLGIVKRGVASKTIIDPKAEANRLVQEQAAERVIRPFGVAPDTQTDPSGTPPAPVENSPQTPNDATPEANAE